jgi:hypothetical protein
MPEWLLVVIGIVAGVVVIGGVIALSLRAERPGKKSWMARPSGDVDRSLDRTGADGAA